MPFLLIIKSTISTFLLLFISPFLSLSLRPLPNFLAHPSSLTFQSLHPLNHAENPLNCSEKRSNPPNPQKKIRSPPPPEKVGESILEGGRGRENGRRKGEWRKEWNTAAILLASYLQCVRVNYGLFQVARYGNID